MNPTPSQGQKQPPLSPTRIEPSVSAPLQKITLAWSSGEVFEMPYTELRFQCPCAACVDEHTGQRIIRRENVRPDVRVTGVQLIGRYAVQISFSDGHGSGIYPYDKLYPLCKASTAS